MNQPHRKVEFESLNLLGKAVYVGGAAVRFVAQSIDTIVDRAVDIVLDAEKAFKQGMDSNIEDAKILEEKIEKRDRKKRPKPPPS